MAFFFNYIGMRKIIDFKNNIIADFLNNELTITDLSTKYVFARSTISKMLKINNINTNKNKNIKSGKFFSKFNKERNNRIKSGEIFTIYNNLKKNEEDIVEMYKGEYSTKEIAAKYKVHKGIVIKILKNNNINFKGKKKKFDLSKIRSTTEKFIKKAKIIHGDRFLYNQVNYIKNTIQIKIYCKECKEYFFQKPYNHLAGCGHIKCGIKRRINNSKNNLNKFIKNLNKSKINNHFSYKKSIYKKAKIKMIIKCNIHKEFFDQTPDSHKRSIGLNYDGCPYCSNKKTTKKGFLEYTKEKFGDIYTFLDISHYVKWKDKLKIKCKNHGFFELEVSKIKKNTVLCPLCNFSKGELIIYNFLNKRIINFKSQGRIEGCRYKNPLVFDFVLFNHNSKIIGVIEYNGEGHYFPVNFKGISNIKAENNFILQQKKDIIKRKFLKKHNIPLLEISYLQKKFIKILTQSFLEKVSNE